MVIRERVSYQAIRDILGGLLEQDLRANRVSSLCDATLGVLQSGSLAICAIGQGLAAARSLKTRHAIKQVDRLLSNTALVVDDIWFAGCVCDWCTQLHRGGHGLDGLRCRQPGHHHAGFDSDHGRSTPLVWQAVGRRLITPRLHPTHRTHSVCQRDFATVRHASQAVTVSSSRAVPLSHRPSRRRAWRGHSV